MVVDYDIAVKMRDGIKIYIDIFRPEKEGQYPVIIGWGPSGRQGRPTVYALMGNTGLNDEDFNRYTGFEAAMRSTGAGMALLLSMPTRAAPGTRRAISRS